MVGKNLFNRLFPSERDSRVAILYEHREITYAELLDQTVRVAERLNALGISEGERVVIVLADSPEFIASFVAIISLGAIAVPINLALRREDQFFILKDCGARVAIVEAQAASSLLINAPLIDLQNILVVQRGSDDASLEIPGIAVDNLATAQRLALSQFPVTRARLGDREALPHGRASDTETDAFILYTSGSTGEPKGAVHSQSDIFYTNETYCYEVLKLRDGDRLFSSSRLPFAYGLGNAFTFPLLNGFTTILCREKPTPEVVSRVFSDYRPTIFFGVPVVFRMLLDHHRSIAPLDTSSLRLCISAGEALPAQLGEEWQKTFGVEVLDGIGSTEVLHMFMSNHRADVRYGSSGRLLRGYEARLIDHEGTPTPPLEVGNLWIRGGSAASRYWQRPELSAETFVDGWTRTGDLYRGDEDGVWWHIGRSDDCFKPTGQWVSPIEVESALMSHGSMRATAVVEGFDKDGLSCVCAFVVPREPSATLEDELRKHCETTLPRFKQPRRYIFVDELPYTATGKVQRFKLREQLRAEPSPSGRREKKQTIMEKSLQEIHAPQMACFGCGPANEKGLHVRSFPQGDEVVATFNPETYQEAFPGMLSGGIIGTLLDCHCNWTAAYHLMKKAGLDHPPCTVTADYAIKLMRPTPTDKPVELRARVVESSEDRAVVEGELIAHDKVCATCHGTFVAVKPGHPAYHRW